MKRWILLTLVAVTSSVAFADEPPPSSPGSAFMKALDADGNGSISKDEFTQPQLQQIAKQFDYMDKNQDGNISIGEADIFAQEMQKHMQEMQNQGGGNPPAGK